MAAGVAGAGMTLPLLASGGAQAASTGTWDRVAQCESGGAWSADTGNGYYGGLLLTQSEWEQYGGLSYAPQPDLASRQQQIAVAEKILAARGVSAWQDCAADAGLTQGGAPAAVDPGVPQTGDGTASGTTRTHDDPPARPSDGPQDTGPDTGPSAPSSSSSASSPTPSASASTAPSGTPSASPTPSGTASSSASPTPSAGSPTTTPSGSPTPTGRHAKPPVPDTTAQAPQETPSAPATGDRGGDDETSRGGSHARPTVPRQGDTSAAYTVRPGDNLSQIATDHSVTGGWPALYDANKSVVGSDPDLILPGQHLTLGH
ncbi:secreted protein [Streptantibioticus cattleyicolor NRRL 8057 = DSM 46488]|uniref:Secreted protein n=1 Tax=Streptantibioticus cattleyicolor (strain ATCC 35852 / DSM 46488 / JCM 4925 / NBRC 14057 / NRRL 8057) TaxID=1003195 RepID=G8WZH3_STREN|nr:secreted protein [Streptantibioticus cattleyicolor NRRL 8057 = DSM 46488]